MKITSFLQGKENTAASQALTSPSSWSGGRWISVLTNSKEEALTMAFRGEQSAGESSLEELTKAIIEDVQRLPGNDVCCDCGSAGILARGVSERVVCTPSTYSQPEWFPPLSVVTCAVRSIWDIPPPPLYHLVLPK